MELYNYDGTMPFTKGDPNINRNGRPKKGTTMTDIMREFLEKERKDPETGKKVKNKYAFVKKVFLLAMEGEVPAIREIWNRLEGMPVAKHEVTGSEGGPLEIVRYSNKS